MKKKHKDDTCRICGAKEGLIKRYDLYICRRCFREVAEKIGFKKY